MPEIEQFLSKDAEKQVKDLVKLMGGLAKSYEQAFKSSKKLDEQITKTSNTTQKQKEQRKELTAIEKEEARILKATETTRAKLQTISTASNKLLVKEQELLKAKNKELRSEANETGKLVGAFRKLNQRRAEAAKRLKDLIASERASTREIQKAQRAFDGLDKKVQKANRSAKQFQSNVGNYPKVFGASTRAIGGFLAAFGFVGGIQLFVNAIKDAFRRIREFDKSIVELAAILGKTRKEIQSIEKEIIKVAGASTKTSTEVAELAVALVTLGASEVEVKNLLKPVNDLSISLKASSEEAGQLLKGTLNAFGESSTAAQRYADVIAKMRTSTALDFQKISDSLSFVAPTAKAVGLTIEQLGARIGILTNNNIKAARAGRLLNSSFARLIKQGVTYDEAMDQINLSTNKAKTASELFGTEAFSLALILAANTEKAAELTKELQNSAGTLDQLTRDQLQSMDARLKILDSSFEKFILTITKGDNFISDSFKWTIDDLSKSFNFLSDIISGTDRKFENWKDRIKKSQPSADLLSLSLDNLSTKLQEQESILEKINTQEGINIDRSLQSKKVTDKKIADINRQIAFLKELEKEREDANAAELQRLADIEAKKEDIRKLALQKERKNQNRLRGIRNAANQAEADAQLQLNFDIDEMLDEQIENELKAEIDLNNELYDINKDRLEKEAQDQEDHLNHLATLFDGFNEGQTESAEEHAKDQAAIREQIIGSSIQLLSELAQGFTDNTIQQLSDESNALELQRQTRLQNVEGDKAKEAQINAEFDKKQSAIKQRQWQAEQKGALFQIAIQTGVNVAKAFPGGPVLIALAFALGLVQAAFVKAQKPPKFGKGSKGLQKDTYAEVGEAGRELLFMPGGGVSLAENSTKAMLPKGTIIKTNRETEQILAANQLRASRENDVAMRDYSELTLLGNSIAEDRKSILKAVNDRDQYIFQVSKEGVKALMKNSRGVTTYLDNRFR